MLSLREFAKIAGVSPATVSRAFAGKDNVVPETKERLFKLAEQVNFRPSAVLGTSSAGDTRSIGVLHPGHSVSYFVDIMLGNQGELLERNYLQIQMRIFKENVLTAFHRLIDQRIDGLIISIPADGNFTMGDFSEIVKYDIPTVCLEGLVWNSAYDCVDTDARMGGRQAAEHLLELGHKKIAMVDSRVMPERKLAFREALVQHGVPLDERFLLTQEEKDSEAIDEELVDKKLLAGLSRKDRPTAVFAPTDVVALQVYHVARINNLRIPEDLSVMGFADLNYAAQISPRLTTIRQNGREEGRQAAELIIERLRNRKAKPRGVLVSTELIVRESTAPPK